MQKATSHPGSDATFRNQHRTVYQGARHPSTNARVRRQHAALERRSAVRSLSTAPLLPQLKDVLKDDYLRLGDNFNFDEYVTSIRQGDDRANDFIDLGIQNLRHAGRYLEMQKQIAEQIPDEAKRPTFVVCYRKNIRDENLHIDRNGNVIADESIGPVKRIGAVGGCGCLSDAELDVQLEIQLDLHESERPLLFFKLSPPVPRDYESAGHAFTIGGYKRRLDLFLNSQNFKKFIIASNTAHVHAGFINFYTNVFTRSKLINLTHKVAGFVKDTLGTSIMKQKDVLILGTTQAYKHELYESLFADKALEYHRVPNEGVQSYEVQGYINDVKANRADDADHRDFYNFIKRLFRRETHSKNILLACTELPLGLSAINPDNGLSYLQTLKDEGYNIFNTEEIFAQAILQEMTEGENREMTFEGVNNKTRRLVMGGLHAVGSVLEASHHTTGVRAFTDEDEGGSAAAASVTGAEDNDDGLDALLADYTRETIKQDSRKRRRRKKKNQEFSPGKATVEAASRSAARRQSSSPRAAAVSKEVFNDVLTRAEAQLDERQRLGRLTAKVRAAAANSERRISGGGSPRQRRQAVHQSSLDVLDQFIQSGGIISEQKEDL